MAIDPTKPIDNGHFVRTEKRFFRQRITIGHHQLRHLIACPQTARLYLVDRREVFRLDTSANKKCKVTDLPFEARCTATGYGWFCAGGEEHGYFAAMRIAEGKPTHEKTQEEQSRQDEDAYWQRYHGSAPPSIRVERLGSQIVNSISIHKLEFDGPQSRSEVVALLTNNDFSVRMWSLTHDREIPFHKFAFPMNHATISPDGKLLVVVGDKEIAHLYVREDLPNLETGNPSYVWQHLRGMRLHKPEDADHAEYFTTAWSPNGTLLAVGSEEGYISVYDVASITESSLEETPLAILPSSRPLTVSGPGAGPGAVRTMCFAPAPWDLLLWSENNGRIGIADVRSLFISRQIVSLDPTDTTVTRAVLTSVPYVHNEEGFDSMHDDILEEEMSRWSRYEVPPGEGSGARSALIRDFATIMAQERREHGRPRGDGLTDEEWQRLDMLRTARQRQDQILRAQQEAQARSREAGPSSSLIPHSNRYRDHPVSHAANVGPSSSRVLRTQSFMNQIRRGAAEQILRDTDDSLRPRRGDVAGHGNTSSPSASTTSSSRDAWHTIEPHLDSSRNDLSSIEDSGLGPVEPLVNLRNTNVAVVTLPGGPSRSEGPLTDEEMQIRLLDQQRQVFQHQRLGRERWMRPQSHRLDWNRSHAATGLPGSEEGSVHSREPLIQGLRRTGIRVPDDVMGMEPHWASTREHGVPTTGVVWDEGRRVVYAGTEEGVFELQMAFEERKTWPSVEMR